MTDPSVKLFRRKGAGGLGRVPAGLLERGPLEPQRSASCCWGRGHRAEEEARDGKAKAAPQAAPRAEVGGGNGATWSRASAVSSLGKLRSRVLSKDGV